jgi:predicted Zn-dependent protease with MMP-like domain
VLAAQRARDGRQLEEDDLDAVVQDAIEPLPPRIKSALDDVAILVEEYPSEELLRESDPPLPPDLLGLFSGASNADRTTSASGVLPGTIHVFRRNIEHFGTAREEVVDELRVTLLHEIGHALGMDEDELHQLGLE